VNFFQQRWKKLSQVIARRLFCRSNLFCSSTSRNEIASPIKPARNDVKLKFFQPAFRGSAKCFTRSEFFPAAVEKIISSHCEASFLPKQSLLFFNFEK